MFQPYQSLSQKAFEDSARVETDLFLKQFFFSNENIAQFVCS